MTYATREAWLQAGIDALRPRFDTVGKPLPELIHVSVGFPSQNALARKNMRIGECWHGDASADKHAHVLISPVLIEPAKYLDVLVHELTHVVTPGSGHKGDFIKVGHAVGLTGKPTSMAAGDALKARLATLAEQLGAFPHAPLAAMRQIKKQGTRMIKCTCAECGYVCRTTHKWLDEVGAPHCPLHGEMETDA